MYVTTTVTSLTEQFRLVGISCAPENMIHVPFAYALDVDKGTFVLQRSIYSSLPCIIMAIPLGSQHPLWRRHQRTRATCARMDVSMTYICGMNMLWYQPIFLLPQERTMSWLTTSMH